MGEATGLLYGIVGAAPRAGMYGRSYGGGATGLL